MTDAAPAFGYEDVRNDVAAPGVGFGYDTNAVTLLRPDADPVTVDLRDKRAIARSILDVVVEIRTSSPTA